MDREATKSALVQLLRMHEQIHHVYGTLYRVCGIEEREPTDDDDIDAGSLDEYLYDISNEMFLMPWPTYVTDIQWIKPGLLLVQRFKGGYRKFGIYDYELKKFVLPIQYVVIKPLDGSDSHLKIVYIDEEINPSRAALSLDKEQDIPDMVMEMTGRTGIFDCNARTIIWSPDFEICDHLTEKLYWIVGHTQGLGILDLEANEIIWTDP